LERFQLEGEALEETEDHLGVTLQEIEEIAALDEPHLGGNEGLGVGVVDRLIEQGGLPQHPPRADDLQDLGLPLGGTLHHLHRAGEYQVEPERRGSLHEDELVGPVVDVADHGGELFQIVLFEIGEDTKIFQLDHPPSPGGSLTWSANLVKPGGLFGALTRGERGL